MPKLCIPTRITELLAITQLAWRPLKAKSPFASMEEFRQFNKEQGLQDRVHHPEQYILNASRILDFHIFNSAKGINEVLNQYDDSKMSTIVQGFWAARNFMVENLDPPIAYLDPLHCVPYIPGPQSENADNLYKKMQLLLWFFLKVDAFATEQLAIALNDKNKAALGFEFIAGIKKYLYGDPSHEDPRAWQKTSAWLSPLIRAMEIRKRIVNLRERLDSYADKYKLKKLNFDEIETQYILPAQEQAKKQAAQPPEHLQECDEDCEEEEIQKQLALRISRREKRKKLIEDKLAVLLEDKNRALIAFKEIEQEKEEADKHLDMLVSMQKASYEKIAYLKSQLSRLAYIYPNAQDKKLDSRIVALVKFIDSKESAIEKAREAASQLLTKIRPHQKLLKGITEKRKTLKQSLKKLETLLKRNYDKKNAILLPKIEKFKKKRLQHFIAKKINQFRQKLATNKQLKKYQKLYAAQSRKRFWRTVLAIIVSVLSGGILALPAYWLWLRAKRNEVIQKFEMTPQHYKEVKTLRQQLYKTKFHFPHKPKKAVTAVTEPNKTAVFYMDKEQANRFRFFESRLKEDNKSALTPKELKNLDESKQRSIWLLTPAAS